MPSEGDTLLSKDRVHSSQHCRPVRTPGPARESETINLSVLLFGQTAICVIMNASSFRLYIRGSLANVNLSLG